MNVLTQQKNVPWRWVFLAVSPWFSGMYVEMCSGVILTLSLKKFMDDPALINAILSINILFNILVGAVCMYISDRIWTRIGRRKPFLLGGWVFLILAFIFVSLAPNLYVLIPLVVIWMACQDVCSTNEPLQQEIVPPHQRGRAGAMFNMIVQCVLIFTFAIVFGRFHEIQYFGRRFLTGEHGAFWLGAVFLIASALLVGFFFKELPVKNSKVGEKISPVSFFKDVFGQKNLWPVYLLVFAQSFMRTQVGAVLTLLFVEQWDYKPQQMGTNMFVGALITIVISIVVGALADKINRIKLYIFGISGALIATLAYYIFVQFFLPDHRPSLVQIISFGQVIAGLGMMAGVVAQPLMYDYIPRDAMGTASAGITYVRSATRWITLLGAGLWVKFYSMLFCEKGTYDYFSVYIYMMLLTCVGIGIILNFQRLVKNGTLIAYGRVGIEEDTPADVSGHEKKTDSEESPRS
jgi:MFS family permease